MNRIKIGIVGCGHIGKRHASIVSNMLGYELMGLCDLRPREELGIDNLQVPLYLSMEEMLDSSPDIEVICIATPNGLHELQSIQALMAGKHVLIEKPMALSKTGCERIIFESLQRSLKVFCVMQNRFSPPAKWLYEIVQSRILGKIYYVQINCFWNRDQRYYTREGWHGRLHEDGGTLFTQFSHFVDMLYWIFGDISNIQARFADFNHQYLTDFEDSGFIQFDLMQGGQGTLNYSTSVWNENLESSVTVIAEKGSIKIGGQYMNEVELCNIKDYQMPQLPPTNPPNNYGPYKGSAANHHYVYENIYNVLHGNGAISTNAMEGLKVVEIIERIYQQKPTHLTKNLTKKINHTYDTNS